MSQKEKRPSIKESVGGLRYCFATTNEVDPQIFSGKYEEEVAVSNVVKSIKRTENGDTTPVYASGRDYDTVSDTSSVDSEVEVVAFDPTDLAKMRGDEITESGLVLKGGSSERPFFAFGQTVFYRQNRKKFRWYPKCKLTADTDDTNTKEKSFSEQNDTVTIRAYPFNDKGQIAVEFDTAVKTATGLTEEKFFNQVITSDEDLKKVIAGD